jgi:hypothetical protein
VIKTRILASDDIQELFNVPGPDLSTLF